MPPSIPGPPAFKVVGEITTAEIVNLPVAAARKKANLRIRQLKELLTSSAETLKDKVKELGEACEVKAKGFMERELITAGCALEAVFGVPLIHKITTISDSFDEAKKIFQVKLSIGFADRTPGIISLHGSSPGFSQDLQMTCEIDQGEAVEALLEEVKEIRKTRNGYMEDIRRLEEFLDTGIEVLEEEFMAHITRTKLAACEDGSGVFKALTDVFADPDVQGLIPQSLIDMGLCGALPAPAETEEGA